MLIPLFAAIAPFIVWTVELFFPYPYIVEELFKALLIYFVLKSEANRATKIKLTIIAGILFAFSETVLYIFNLLLVGNLNLLFERLLITTSLHVLTSLAILIPAMYNKKLIVVGIVLAMIIHYYFNIFIPLIK